MTHTQDHVSTSPDVESLDSIDWAIPCEYPIHKGRETATWAVWYRTVYPCGCAGTLPFRYFCSPCWEYRSAPGGVVRCKTCDAALPPMSTVLRVEAI